MTIQVNPDEESVTLTFQNHKERIAVKERLPNSLMQFNNGSYWASTENLPELLIAAKTLNDNDTVAKIQSEIDNYKARRFYQAKVRLSFSGDFIYAKIRDSQMRLRLLDSIVAVSYDEHTTTFQLNWNDRWKLKALLIREKEYAALEILDIELGKR